MRRLPVLPTLLVLVMIPTMVALGFWQLRRAEWKEGLLARLAANVGAPVVDAPPGLMDRREEMSFRRVRLACADVRLAAPTAARGRDGSAGYRQTARCRRHDGEAVLVSLGVSPDPTQRPTAIPLLFTGPLVPRDGDPAFLLVSETPVGPNLVAEGAPSVDTIPNNHRGYAFQWFAFATVLGVIYLIYVRSRVAGRFAKSAPRR